MHISIAIHVLLIATCFSFNFTFGLAPHSQLAIRQFALKHTSDSWPRPQTNDWHILKTRKGKIKSILEQNLEENDKNTKKSVEGTKSDNSSKLIIKRTLKQEHHHNNQQQPQLVDEANRLFEDLMTPYNKHVRPVKESTDILVVKLGLSLSQIIDVNLRYQMMTSIVWVEQEWTDSKLKWEPADYGGVTKLHIPAEDLWRPDIVLYNNADGDYVVTSMNKAIVHFDGRVDWRPPAIYKSSCNIDVSYFPFDQQTCLMKFGTWTYNGNFIELRHKNQAEANASKNSSSQIDVGMDLSSYLLSVEWDVIATPAIRHEIAYECCVGSFYDVTFYLTLRRKTLFYTVNLIVPCIVMSLLSILVFYLPSDSNEKVSLTISIVVSVDVFLLCLVEIMPPTSFVVPLLGQYLIFTLCLMTLSVFSTVYVLNISFRNPSSHKMGAFQRKLFLHQLPSFLMMHKRDIKRQANCEMAKTRFVHNQSKHQSNFASDDFYNAAEPQEGLEINTYGNGEFDDKHLKRRRRKISTTSYDELIKGQQTVNLKNLHSQVTNAFLSLDFVAKRMENRENFNAIEEDWQYMATVLDRLLLVLFSSVWLIGSALIVFQAPTLYDYTQPIDAKLSKFASEFARNQS